MIEIKKFLSKYIKDKQKRNFCTFIVWLEIEAIAVTISEILVPQITVLQSSRELQNCNFLPGDAYFMHRFRMCRLWRRARASW